MLEMLGLEEVDDVVYGHIAHRFDCTAEQVARNEGLPDQQVRESVSRLIGAGLVCTEQVGRLRPTSNGPLVATDRLRAQVDADYARRRSDITVLYAELAGLLERHPVLGPAGLKPTIDRIGDPEAARLQVAGLLGAVREEIARITRSPVSGAAGRPSTDNEPAEIAALRRGVGLRLIYPTAFFADDGLRGMIRPRLNEGGELRAVPDPPVELLALDRQVIVLTENRSAHDEDGGGHATLIVRGRGLVEALYALFENCWSQASTVDHYLEVEEDGSGAEPSVPLAPSDRIMLRLLGDGTKDEVVARRLGVSVRTVRRRVSEILRTMNATSRFQGGVLAERRGWL
ncbi:hypothetical protein J4573_24480 [Actinomadura barringtoniae]|uniref:HTH luxR-type domain-containing protein n=1 Tax=Actinomadura barringtoniae TaxID=1427535 RepID=A0A939TBK5_9ACTN|nr:LuxR C-terminal-related transcriptional regulator [Actinomadura barringtoniae]MBO2450280.1 hypothetical protein [Actinomadura barringtoniae]